MLIEPRPRAILGLALWRQALVLHIYHAGTLLLLLPCFLVPVWSLLFVFGIPRVIKHRIAWGFASNVIVFERLTGDEAYERCEALADAHYGPGLRALVAIPSLLAVGSLVMLISARNAPQLGWLGATW